MSARKQSMSATVRYYSRFLLQRTVNLSPLGALLASDSNGLPSANDKRRRSSSLVDNVIVLVALLTLTYVTASSLPDVFHSGRNIAPSAYILHKNGHLSADNAYSRVVQQHAALYDSERQKMLSGSSRSGVGSDAVISTLQTIADKAKVVGPALPNVLTNIHPIDSAKAVGEQVVNKLNQAAALPAGPTQPPSASLSSEPVRQQLRATFLHAWHDGYAKYAFGHDELLPVSNGTSDDAVGFGLTAIESLDTAVLMGLTEIVTRVEQHVAATTWRADRVVASKHVNQRYLGSLLSAFTLTNKPVYLTKAIELADAALASFDQTPSLMQPAVFNLLTGVSPDPSKAVSVADVSSCMLEYSVLSHINTNKQYQQKCANARQQLLDALALVNDEPAQDGLLPLYVDVASTPAKFSNELQYTVDHRTVSLYAGLLKSYILSNYEDQDALHAYLRAMSAIEKHLLTVRTGTYTDKNPSSPTYNQQLTTSYAFVGSINNKQRVNQQAHSACALPGLLALGYHTLQQLGSGRTMSPSELLLQSVAEHHLQLAQQLANTCTGMYFSTQTGLPPHVVEFSQLQTSADSQVELNHVYDLNKKMFTIVDARYRLDDEFVESLLVLWRVTHNQWYRDTAYTILQSIEQQCRTPAAYSGLKNVDAASSPDNWDDRLPSHFTGRTLKQLFLLFSEDKFVPLSTYVLNAYGHPLDIFKGGR